MVNRFLGSGLGGNRRGQSPVEYRGNLYAPSVRPSVHTYVSPPPPVAPQRLIQAFHGLAQASQRLVQASPRLVQASQRLAKASHRLARLVRGWPRSLGVSPMPLRGWPRSLRNWPRSLRAWLRSLLAWLRPLRGLFEGLKDGKMDGRMDGTYRFPLYSTGLCPLRFLPGPLPKKLWTIRVNFGLSS